LITCALKDFHALGDLIGEAAAIGDGLGHSAALLQDYANRIGDEALRTSLLENVATHRAILKAARMAHTLASRPS
jgi:hypothetical protein